MIILERELEYKINSLILKDVKTKTFLEQSLFPVLNFIEQKGLTIIIPSVIDGADVSFIYRKLQERNLGPTAEQLSLFIYSRLTQKDPIKIKHSVLFTEVTNASRVGKY